VEQWKSYKIRRGAPEIHTIPAQGQPLRLTHPHRAEMIFDIVTVFPGFFHSILEYGILKRAIAGGQIEIRLHDLRDFTDDVHRTVDDRPFGGGPGMVFKPEPIFRAVESIKAK